MSHLNTRFIQYFHVHIHAHIQIHAHIHIHLRILITSRCAIAR